MLRLVLVAVAIALLGPASRSPASADTGVVVATVTVATDASVALQVSNGRLATGIPFHIDARISGAVDGATHVRLHASPALLVKGSLSQDLGPHGKPRWALCSDLPGAYIVMASLEWPDGRRIESEAVVVHVAPSKKTACPRPWV